MRSQSLCWLCWFALCCANSAANGGEADKKIAPASANAVSSFLKRWGLADENERNHASVRGVFREIVAPAGQATVRVLSDETPSSLGVIVDPRGFVIAKASELGTGRLECVLSDRRRLPAVRLAHRDDLDLVLLKISASALPVIQWSESPLPGVGSWLASPNIDGEPAAIGIVSTSVHNIPSPQPVLGVELERADQGVRVHRVLSGFGAARAGIQPGDIIASMNGTSAETPATLTDMILRLHPGDKVTLSVRRASESLSVIATLGDKTRAGRQEQAELMDSLGGPLSRRRAGFAAVLQHDSVLRPRDCGGPLVDLDGKVVGINIARASRVASYALPATVVRNAVTEMLNGVRDSRLAEHPVATNP